MRLEIGVPVTAFDLANALQGEQGTFLCQSGGQTYLTVAKAGHSIAYGPTPIGRKVLEVAPAAIEPWSVTKISSQDVSREFQQGPAVATGIQQPRK